jgi:hypothetical protein
MGAPSSEDIITGDYEKTDINAKHGANQRAIM